MIETTWLDGRVPNGFWGCPEHRAAYMRWLGKRLQFREPDDWYALRRSHFKRNRGGALLAMVYRDSPLEAMRDFMPHRRWLPWLFGRTPQRYWAKKVNRRAYMRWLERELGIEHPDRWYDVTKQDFVEHAGHGLLANYFNHSVAAAVMEYLPRRRWQPWRFRSVPQGFWQHAENRRAYLDWLAARLRIRTPEQWYHVTVQTLVEHHGATLVARYNYSVLDILREYLPAYDWKPWLFRRIPSGYWDNPGNRHSYLVWLGQELGFRQPSDWCRLTADDVVRTGGGTLLSAVYGCQLAALLRERFPDYDRTGESPAGGSRIAG